GDDAPAAQHDDDHEPDDDARERHGEGQDGPEQTFARKPRPNQDPRGRHAQEHGPRRNEERQDHAVRTRGEEVAVGEELRIVPEGGRCYPLAQSAEANLPRTPLEDLAPRHEAIRGHVAGWIDEEYHQEEYERHEKQRTGSRSHASGPVLEPREVRS